MRNKTFAVVLLFCLSFLFYQLFIHNPEKELIKDVGEVENLTLPLKYLDNPFVLLPFLVDFYTVYASVEAVAMPLYSEANLWYFISLLIGFSLLLAAATAFKRFLFLLTMTIFIFYMSSLGLELLEILDHWHIKFFAYFTLFIALVPCVVFHFFKRNTSLELRTFTFLVLFLGLTLISSYYSEVTAPLAIVVQNSFLTPVLLTCVFAIFLSVPIYKLFLKLITDTKLQSQKNNHFNHIAVIFSIFLLNSVYTYLYLMEGIDWGLYYLHPFVLFSLSYVLILWKSELGFPTLNALFKNNLHEKIFLAGWGMISLGTLAFQKQTLNDPALESLEDILLVIFLSAAVFFYVQVVIIYRPALQEGRNVYHMTAQITTRTRTFYHGLLVASVFFSIVLLGVHQFNAYYRLFAGYYTGIAEIHRSQNNDLLTNRHLAYATSYIPNTHKANYLLGNFYKRQHERRKALAFFQDATQKNPLLVDFLEIEQLLASKRQHAQAVDALKEGLIAFPKSAEIHQKLAFHYEKLQKYREAEYHFASAVQYDKSPKSLMNQSAFFVRNGYYSDYINSDFTDDISEWSVGHYANSLLMEHRKGNLVEVPLQTEFLQDSVLTTFSLCYLYNHTLTKKHGNSDSKKILSQLERLAKVSENVPFVEYLQFAKAIVYYKVGNFKKTIHLLKQLDAQTGRIYSLYTSVIGYLLIELQDYEQAAFYFEKSAKRGEQTAWYFLAYCQNWISDKHTAGKAWKKAAKENEGILWKTASRASAILQDTLHDDLQKADSLSIFLNIPYIGLSEFQKAIAQLPSQEIRNELQHRYVDFYLSRKDTLMAYTLLKSIPVAERSQRNLLSFLNAKELNLSDVDTAKIKPIDKGYLYLQMGTNHFRKSNFSEAVRYLSKSVQILATQPIVYLTLAAALEKHSKPDESYNTLLESLEFCPFSTDLYKAYILKCQDLGYASFAEHALETLEEISSQEEYTSFLEAYGEREILEEWE